MRTIINAIDLSLAIVAMVYMVQMVKRDIQMLQQNSYRNERYKKWLKQNSEYTSASRMVCMIMGLMLVSTFAPAQLFIAFKVIFAVVLVVMSMKLAKTKYKHSLVFTKRVKRLMTVELLLIAVVLAVYSYASWNMSGLCRAIAFGGIAFSAFSYAITMVTNKVMQPVENAINKSFVNDAKRILKQMPDMKIIGITGSYGKTSTKHYLERILSEQYSVLMTPGSYNTPMGVTRTVREMLQPYNEVFIVEMGAKNVGDIKEICDIVNPQIGVVTAVGPQHLESFKTIENVQKTKFELVDALPADGLAVLNDDFEYVANRTVNNVDVKRYAVMAEENADYKVENIEYSASGTTFTVVGEGKRIELKTKLVGECNISNLMGAVIVALKLGVPEEKIKYAVSKIAQVEHRLSIKRTPAGVVIIDDAFNSNPDGSRMALDVLSMMTGGKRIVITPGMIELGDKQEYYNEKFGEHIAETCDVAIIVGQYNRNAIVKGIKSKGWNEGEKLIVTDTFNEAQAMLAGIATKGDTVLYENDLPDTFK